MSPFNPKLYPTEADVDRAYHPFPEDDAWKKVTLAYVVSQGRRVVLGCCGCQKSKMFWPEPFAEQHGIDLNTPLLIVERRIRCTTCGQRLIHLRPETYDPKYDRLGHPRE